jgi:hypothetical protein
MVVTRALCPLKTRGADIFKGATKFKTPPLKNRPPAPKAAVEATLNVPALNTTPPLSVLTPVSETVPAEFARSEPAPLRPLERMIVDPALPLTVSEADAPTLTEPVPTALLLATTNVPVVTVVPPV